MDQQGLASIALSAAVAAIGFTLMGFFVGWGWIFIRLNNQQPILEFEPRRPVPWTGVSLAVAIFGFIVLLAVVGVVVRALDVSKPGDLATVAAPEPGPVANEVAPLPPSNAPSNRQTRANPAPPNQPPPNQPLPKQAPGQAKRPFPIVAIWLDSGIKLTFVVLAVVAFAVSGATIRDLGISLRHWKRDLIAGVLGFCTVAPLVLMLQAALVKFWQPSVHPLIESLRANLTLECWLAVTVAAVIGAPIFEEFAFRVLLQGWLEKLCDTTPTPVPPEASNQFVVGNAPAVAQAQPHNPYVSPTHVGSVPASTSQEPRTPAGDVLPIIFSSLVFALMHYSHGPDWVALIPFAVMLGFLYRRTHRIWPSIIAHFMLNSFSMTVLTFSFFWPGAAAKL